MVIFDLRLAIFALVASWAISLMLAIWLRRVLSPRAEALLPDSIEMQSAIEQAPFGLLVLGAKTSCQYANPSARQMLGLEVTPSHLPDAGWVRLLEGDRLATRDGTTGAGRYRNARTGPGQAVQWWVTACRNVDLVFLLDAGSSLRAEESAHILLSDLGHELRTPLATLLTHIEVLRLPQVSEETRERSIALMQQELKRMTRLVHNLLELGHLEMGPGIERRSVEMVALAQDVVAQVLGQAKGRGIGIDLQVDTPLPLVVGDADRLRQVFLNLLDNAIKYSRTGDRVKFTLCSESSSKKVICEICDTGPGIPPEHLPNITRRFYRAASEEIAGSGLGLSLVDEILKHHGSKLEIVSQSEGTETGTCVRFPLPAASESPGR